MGLMTYFASKRRLKADNERLQDRAEHYRLLSERMLDALKQAERTNATLRSELRVYAPPPHRPVPPRDIVHVDQLPRTRSSFAPASSSPAPSPAPIPDMPMGGFKDWAPTILPTDPPPPEKRPISGTGGQFAGAGATGEWDDDSNRKTSNVAVAAADTRADPPASSSESSSSSDSSSSTSD